MTNKTKSISHEKLKESLFYNETTGIFTWIKSASPKIKQGNIAGCKDRDGYILIRIDKVLYKAHRLAWFYFYGIWPENEIDHIDGNPDNNIICNLREATRSQNMMNTKISKRNTTGFKGVYRSGKKWEVKIHTFSDGDIYIGVFNTIEDANFARLAAENIYFKEFQKQFKD